jgi:DNA-binding MarR family transcriptional regulator
MNKNRVATLERVAYHRLKEANLSALTKGQSYHDGEKILEKAIFLPNLRALNQRLNIEKSASLRNVGKYLLSRKLALWVPLHGKRKLIAFSKLPLIIQAYKQVINLSPVHEKIIKLLGEPKAKEVVLAELSTKKASKALDELINNLYILQLPGKERILRTREDIIRSFGDNKDWRNTSNAQKTLVLQTIKTYQPITPFSLMQLLNITPTDFGRIVLDLTAEEKITRDFRVTGERGEYYTTPDFSAENLLSLETDESKYIILDHEDPFTLTWKNHEKWRFQDLPYVLCDKGVPIAEFQLARQTHRSDRLYGVKTFKPVGQLHKVSQEEFKKAIDIWTIVTHQKIDISALEKNRRIWMQQFIAISQQQGFVLKGKSLVKQFEATEEETSEFEWSTLFPILCKLQKIGPHNLEDESKATYLLEKIGQINNLDSLLMRLSSTGTIDSFLESENLSQLLTIKGLSKRSGFISSNQNELYWNACSPERKIELDFIEKKILKIIEMKKEASEGVIRDELMITASQLKSALNSIEKGGYVARRFQKGGKGRLVYELRGDGEPPLEQEKVAAQKIILTTILNTQLPQTIDQLERYTGFGIDRIVQILSEEEQNGLLKRGSFLGGARTIQYTTWENYQRFKVAEQEEIEGLSIFLIPPGDPVIRMNNLALQKLLPTIGFEDPETIKAVIRPTPFSHGYLVVVNDQIHGIIIMKRVDRDKYVICNLVLSSLLKLEPKTVITETLNQIILSYGRLRTDLVKLALSKIQNISLIDSSMKDYRFIAESLGIECYSE